jgi:hypothetical protein
MRNEKENLKSILNKEYGWFKKDSTIKQEPAPKPKFRIQWDESDSTGIKADTAKGNPERGLNRIFKKKKEQDL